MADRYGVSVEDSQDVAQAFDIVVVPAKATRAASWVKMSLDKQDVLARLQSQFGLSAADSVKFLAKPEATRVLPNWQVSDEVLADYGPLED
jgi:hypothetical protein